MHQFDSVSDIRSFVYQRRAEELSIGLVPTMGALHEGHLSLARAATEKCDVTVATIFVNPNQFAEGEDLDKYPRTVDQDCQALESIGVDAVFIPTEQEMYPEGFSTYLAPPDVAQRWEGEFRPVHFRGVATIVMKLFQAIPATHAFFGRKDYQQLRVVQAMVRDLNVGIEIVGCETVRESDGLAMSSRNRYLSDEERRRALLISESLGRVADAVQNGESNVTTLQDELHQGLRGSNNASDHPGGVDKIDYAVIVDPQTLDPLPSVDRPAMALVACHVGGTRLIDNRLVSPPTH